MRTLLLQLDIDDLVAVLLAIVTRLSWRGLLTRSDVARVRAALDSREEIERAA